MKMGGLYRQYMYSGGDQSEHGTSNYGNQSSFTEECFELPDLPIEIKDGVDLQVLLIMIHIHIMSILFL